MKKNEETVKYNLNKTDFSNNNWKVDDHCHLSGKF